MAVSNMAKALDPVRQVQAGSPLAFWREVFGKLDRLYKLNLVICPSSAIQDKESRVHPLSSEIEAVYDHLSNSVSYGFPEQTQTVELRHGMMQWLGGTAVEYESISRSSVLEGRLDTWVERVQVRLPGGAFLHPPEHTRANRDRAHAALLDQVERWRTSTVSFEEQFRRELAAGAEVLADSFKKHLLEQQRYFSGDMTALDAAIDAPLLATIIPNLMSLVHQNRASPTRALDTVMAFLTSDEGCRAPYNWNSALLIAGLVRKVQAGQKTLNSGTLNDVITLSSIAPYCDAIFVDDAMAGLLRESPLADRFVRTAEVFSNRSRAQFVAYLDGIEAAAPDGHIDLISAIYGPKWTEPFWGLVEWLRERSGST